MLLAILGPLLLLPVWWLVYRFGTLPLLRSIWSKKPPGQTKAAALSLALLFMLVILAVSYVPGRVEYGRLCARDGSPVVSERVDVEGLLYGPLFQYEARPLLDDGGFDFVEAPDQYRDGIYVRYTLAEDGGLEREEVGSLRSRYGLRKELITHPRGTIRTQKVVYELGSERELARAANLVYEGGPLSIFLGVYGMSSCPDIRTAQGSEDFRVFYELETHVLKAGADAGSP